MHAENMPKRQACMRHLWRLAASRPAVLHSALRRSKFVTQSSFMSCVNVGSRSNGQRDKVAAERILGSNGTASP